MIQVSDERRKNYAVRIESLLIVSWNTIRLTDLPVARFVDEQLGVTTPEEVMKLNILNRSTPHMRYRGLSRESYYKTIKLIYPDAYYEAPPTLLHSILYSIAFKGVKEIVVAHNTFMDTVDISTMLEEHVINVPFNGTIEHLEELITMHGSTGIIVDDLEYVKELIERKNIPISGMSFIVPMIGYNFINTKNGKEYKFKEFLDNAALEFEFDLAFADLFVLSKEKLEACLEEK